jgi:hypothetical protein
MKRYLQNRVTTKILLFILTSILFRKHQLRKTQKSLKLKENQNLGLVNKLQLLYYSAWSKRLYRFSSSVSMYVNKKICGKLCLQNSDAEPLKKWVHAIDIIDNLEWVLYLKADVQAMGHLATIVGSRPSEYVSIFWL